MYRHDVSGATTSGNYPTKTTASSGATNVYDSTYYFITDAFRVYQVLYNGDATQTGASNITGANPTNEATQPFWHDNNYYLKFMYKLTTSQIQNFLTTDFMPVVVNNDNPTVRGILVVMVTSGGANYPNGTFYTKGKEVMVMEMQKVALVVSGGAITEFGQNNASNTYVSASGADYTFATIDLSTANIFTDANCTTAISGATATSWTNATAGSITPIIEPLVVLVLMILLNLVDIMLWFKESLHQQIQMQLK